MPISTRTRPYLNPQQGGTIRAPQAYPASRPGPSLWDGATVVIPAVFEAAFAGDAFTISAELYRATMDNQPVEDISAFMVDGDISMSVDRDIKLAMNVTIRQPSLIRPYTDFLAPFIRLTFHDGTPEVYQQVGLYTTRVAPGTYTVNDALGKFQCDDLTSVLATSYYTDAITNLAGILLSDAVILSITNGGITRSNIPASTATLPADQSFPIGTSRLEKANALLDQLGWYHLGTDLDGRISTPGAPQPLAQMEPWRTLTDGDVKSVIDVTPVGIEIANVVLVINDNAAAAPLSSIATNSDASSPTSTVAIGRSIMRLVKVTGSTTQAALDALAARYLAESRTRYRTVKLTILHDPTALKIHQVVKLVLTGEQEGLSGNWWIREATMGFTPDKPTVLTLSQITDDLNEVTV